MAASLALISLLIAQGLKKNANQYEVVQRFKKQKQLKHLMDTWMLQRFQQIIAHEMPQKFDAIVVCRLAPEQVHCVSLGVPRSASETECLRVRLGASDCFRWSLIASDGL